MKMLPDFANKYIPQQKGTAMANRVTYKTTISAKKIFITRPPIETEVTKL
jgi:hypothetical protein